MVATFAAAQTGGFLAVLTPAGLGVREAVLTAFLSRTLLPSQAGLVALLSRVWFVAAEVLCLVIAAVDVLRSSRVEGLRVMTPNGSCPADEPPDSPNASAHI
jgi:uncharacterized membrane protein YbhN (UPF0104 family)